MNHREKESARKEKEDIERNRYLERGGEEESGRGKERDGGEKKGESDKERGK